MKFYNPLQNFNNNINLTLFISIYLKVKKDEDNKKLLKEFQITEKFKKNDLSELKNDFNIL